MIAVRVIFITIYRCKKRPAVESNVTPTFVSLSAAHDSHGRRLVTSIRLERIQNDSNFPKRMDLKLVTGRVPGPVHFRWVVGFGNQAHLPTVGPCTAETASRRPNLHATFSLGVRKVFILLLMGAAAAANGGGWTG